MTDTEQLGRQILECAVTLALFGVMALWVKLNRLGLMLASERHVAPVPLRRTSISHVLRFMTRSTAVKSASTRRARHRKEVEEVAVAAS
jgi:predicted DNA repair protein MutK